MSPTEPDRCGAAPGRDPDAPAGPCPPGGAGGGSLTSRASKTALQEAFGQRMRTPR
jgi:hypothetical protein